MTKPQPSPSLTTGGEIQLKPCPFCGGVEEVSFRIERTPSGMREVPFFICGACAAEGAKPVASWVRDTGDPDEMRAAAVAAWNRRAPLLREEVGEGSLAMTPASSLSSGGRPPVAKTTA